GKIVISGSLNRFLPGNFFDIAVARFNQDGSLDPSFDGDGKLVFDAGTSEASDAIAIQNDGKIIVVGSGGSIPGLLLLRLNTNVTCDSSFDGDGVVETPRVGEADAKLQSDGKIVVVGQTNELSFFSAWRYNQDGSLDTSFGLNGFVATSFSDITIDTPFALSV